MLAIFIVFSALFIKYIICSMMNEWTDKQLNNY